MLAAHKARHRRRTERCGGRKRRPGNFGFITQSVGQDGGFSISSCHVLYLPRVELLKVLRPIGCSLDPGALFGEGGWMIA